MTWSIMEDYILPNLGTRPPSVKTAKRKCNWRWKELNPWPYFPKTKNQIASPLRLLLTTMDGGISVYQSTGQCRDRRHETILYCGTVVNMYAEVQSINRQMNGDSLLLNYTISQSINHRINFIYSQKQILRTKFVTKAMDEWKWENLWQMLSWKKSDNVIIQACHLNSFWTKRSPCEWCNYDSIFREFVTTLDLFWPNSIGSYGRQFSCWSQRFKHRHE